MSGRSEKAKRANGERMQVQVQIDDPAQVAGVLMSAAGSLQQAAGDLRSEVPKMRQAEVLGRICEAMQALLLSHASLQRTRIKRVMPAAVMPAGGRIKL